MVDASIEDSRRVPKKVSFDTQEISALCGNLVAVKHVPVIYDKKTLPVQKARHRYLAACFILNSALHLFANNPTKKQKIIDGILKA